MVAPDVCFVSSMKPSHSRHSEGVASPFGLQPLWLKGGPRWSTSDPHPLLCQVRRDRGLGIGVTWPGDVVFVDDDDDVDDDVDDEDDEEDILTVLQYSAFIPMITTGITFIDILRLIAKTPFFSYDNASCSCCCRCCCCCCCSSSSSSFSSSSSSCRRRLSSILAILVIIWRACLLRIIMFLCCSPPPSSFSDLPHFFALQYCLSTFLLLPAFLLLRFCFSFFVFLPFLSCSFALASACLLFGFCPSVLLLLLPLCCFSAFASTPLLRIRDSTFNMLQTLCKQPNRTIIVRQNAKREEI